jgi:glycosyltransferase involved in cell wall biosynthesis
LKIMEYLAAGLPVVASRQGEIPEIVGDAGLLIRPDDVHALRDGLRTLLADPARRRAMAEAARRQARLLTWDVTATRVETVLTTAQKPGARRLHRPVVDTIGLAELRS